MSAHETDNEKLRILVKFVFAGMDYIDWFVDYYRRNVRREKVDEEALFVEFVEYAKSIHKLIGKTVIQRISSENNIQVYRRRHPYNDKRTIFYSEKFDESAPTLEFAETPFEMFRDYMGYLQYANVALANTLSIKPNISLKDGFAVEDDICEEEMASRYHCANDVLDKIYRKNKAAIDKLDTTKLEHVMWCWVVATMTRMPLIHHMGIARHIQNRTLDQEAYSGLADTSLVFSMAIQAQLAHYDERIDERILNCEFNYLSGFCERVATVLENGPSGSKRQAPVSRGEGPSNTKQRRVSPTGSKKCYAF